MSHVVIEQVYSTLMALDPDANPYPELGESFESLPMASTYKFKLHPGIKFHNGDELTAEDVKFSFDRLRAKDSDYSYGAQVESIASVDVIDPLTVELQAEQAHRPVPHLYGLSRQLDRSEEARRVGHDLNAKPVGSGPFKFVSYEPRSAIKFERNPDYFQAGKPYFDAWSTASFPTSRR